MGGGLNDSMESNETQWLHAVELRVTFTFIYSVLTFIGSVGNILVITVVLKVKGMLTPTNCYLVSLAASDCIFFLAATPTELHYVYYTNAGYKFGPIPCALLTYLSYLAINISSLSMAAFTIERYIGICHPMRAKSLCTVKRARIIIAGIWLFSLLYNSSWLFITQIKASGITKSCTFRIDRNGAIYKIIYVGDILAFYFTPLMLEIILYGKIACILVGSGPEGVSDTRPTPSLEHHSSDRDRSSDSPFAERARKRFFKPFTTLQLRHSTGPDLRHAVVLQNASAHQRLRSNESTPADHPNLNQASSVDSLNNRAETTILLTPTFNGGPPPPSQRLLVDRPTELNLNSTPLGSRSRKPLCRAGASSEGRQRRSLAQSKSSSDETSRLLRKGRLQSEKSPQELTAETGSIESKSPRDSFVTGSKKRKCGRTQVIKMLVVIVFVFAICWLPYRALVVYNSFATETFTEDWYIWISKTMIYITCAINPILYDLMSAKFRAAFRQLLTDCFKHRKKWKPSKKRKNVPRQASQSQRGLPNISLSNPEGSNWRESIRLKFGVRKKNPEQTFPHPKPLMRVTSCPSSTSSHASIQEPNPN